MLEFTMKLSFYVTMYLGIGILVVAGYYVWDYAFKCVLAFIKIHGLFIQFIYDYYRKKREPKVVTPKIKRKEDE